MVNVQKIDENEVVQRWKLRPSRGRKHIRGQRSAFLGPKIRCRYDYDRSQPWRSNHHQFRLSTNITRNYLQYIHSVPQIALSFQINHCIEGVPNQTWHFKNPHRALLSIALSLVSGAARFNHQLLESI